MEALFGALGALDTQLYLAITTSRNAVTGALAVALTLANTSGAVWWLLAFLGARLRSGRRALLAATSVATGLLGGWLVAELLKLVFGRARPFLAIASAPPTLVDRPAGFAFPSGDTALAFGAAIALGGVMPRSRLPALLLATGVGLARVTVGVHYPFDVLAGAVVGIAAGLAAPRAVTLLRRQLPWRAFVIAHTHWDREWYERFEAFRARLVPMVSGLLDTLEREERYRSFTFDGQTIAIEDHLAVRPADRPRIEALVRAERLFVGPWYVLADLLLVGGEAIVRNLQEGLRVAGSLGRALRVAYVADPFGHPAQLPQILRGFGYTNYVFARGMGDESEEVGSEFNWEAPSGDRVQATHLAAHYSNGQPLVGPPGETPKDLGARVRRVTTGVLDRAATYANGAPVLVMVGNDHVSAYPRLPEAVEAMRGAAPRLDARIASLEEYAAALGPARRTVAGELVRGRYRPILRGVNSARAWIKQENAACERLLLERCEPLDALGGGSAGDELRALWRILLQNHPHDSICGCSIDAVHDVDMAARFALVRERGEALASRLATSLGGSGERTMVWSALPWERSAVTALAGVPSRVRCAALGVRTAQRDPGTVSSPEDGVIENEALRVVVGLDGSFLITDRATGERSGRQNVLLDEGDRGDLYTHSYAGPAIGSSGLRGTRTTGVEGDRATVTVEFALGLPAALRADRLARSPDLVDCPVRASISLDAGARRVDVALSIENRARDHRLRVLCETSTRSLTHVAGAAFAWLERPTRVSPKRGWREQPTAERCVHDFVAVEGSQRGIAVGVEGLREYGVLHDGGTIAITLLRAVGWLSRDDLPERRGHAGPATETPSAQCLGTVVARYCLVPLGAGETRLPRAVRAIREWLSPPWIQPGDGVTRSFLSIAEPDTPLALTALRSGPGGSLVVRLANPTRSPASATLRFARPVRIGRAVDLREGDLALGNTGLETIRTAAPLEAVAGDAVARLAPYEIGTWSVRLD